MLYGCFKIWKNLHCLGVPILRKILRLSETIDLCQSNLGFRVKKEFLLLNFSTILRFRVNKENYLLYKGAIFKFRAKFTFNFLPNSYCFPLKLLRFLGSIWWFRLILQFYSWKKAIFLLNLSNCSEFFKNVMPQFSSERVKTKHFYLVLIALHSKHANTPNFLTNPSHFLTLKGIKNGKHDIILLSSFPLRQVSLWTFLYKSKLK